MRRYRWSINQERVLHADCREARGTATTTSKETVNVEDAVNYYCGTNVITTMQFVLHSFVVVIQS